MTAVTKLAREADAVLVVATPFGPDNVGNLGALIEADVARKCGVVGEMTAGMDFSRGEALAAWERLVASGAVHAPTVAAAIPVIEGMVSR